MGYLIREAFNFQTKKDFRKSTKSTVSVLLNNPDKISTFESLITNRSNIHLTN